jgi:hypothetical protein
MKPSEVEYRKEIWDTVVSQKSLFVVHPTALLRG